MLDSVLILLLKRDIEVFSPMGMRHFRDPVLWNIRVSVILILCLGKDRDSMHLLTKENETLFSALGMCASAFGQVVGPF